VTQSCCSYISIETVKPHY